MDIINKKEDLERFKDYKNKIVRFEQAVEFKCSIELEAGWSIEAGGFIKAWGFIKAGWFIKAGGFIKAGEFIFSFTFSISAEFIKTRILPFWREYWAEMPPLQKWRDNILNDTCWDELRELPTEEEKKEIVKWDGWHWLLRGQLECFLRLKDRFEPPNTKERSNE